MLELPVSGAGPDEEPDVEGSVVELVLVVVDVPGSVVDVVELVPTLVGPSDELPVEVVPGSAAVEPASLSAGESVSGAKHPMTLTQSTEIVPYRQVRLVAMQGKCTHVRF